jgi:hypothetical protein
MAKLSTDLRSAVLHPRETLRITGPISALNGEVITDCDGCASVALDLRGTFNGTIQVLGTVDGTNWTLIPLRPLNTAAVLYVASVVGAVPGTWVGSCAGFARVRALATAWTSGTATTTLAASNAPLDQSLLGMVAPGIGTAVGAASAAVTLTLASPGAGLRHYITYLSIARYAAIALTATGTPITVTTTNLPGTLAFTMPTDALPLGAIDRWREDFAYAIAANAQGTATTIVCPATTNVIWRITAGLYVAP